MKTRIFKTHLFRDKKISREIEIIGFDTVEPKTKYPRVLKKVGQAPEQYPEVEE